MPTVPRYGDRKVQEQGTPSSRLNTNVDRRAYVQDTPDYTPVIREVARMVQQEQSNADELALVDAERRLSELETTLLYNPETGAMQRKGKTAFTLPEEVMSQWRVEVGKIESGLHGERQKTGFKRLESQRTTNVDRTVQRHVAGERQSYDSEVTESLLINERTAAVTNYQDADRVEQALTAQRTALASHAQRMGLPAEWLEQKTATAVSQTRASVVNRILTVGDDRTASAYYQQHKKDFTGTDAEAIEKALEEGSTRGASQRQADTIMQTHPTDRAAALAAVRQIDDPKLRDATHSRVTQAIAEQQAVQRERADRLYQQAMTIVEQRPSLNWQARDVIPPATWAALTPEQRNSLERRNEDVPNNNRLWLNFLSLTPQATAGLNRNEFEIKYWSHFDLGHRARAEAMWNGAIDAANRSRSGQTPDPQWAATLTFNDRVQNTLKSTGILDPNKATSKLNEREAKLVADFETEAAKRVQAFEQSRYKGTQRANGEEVQVILDDLAIKRVFVDKPWAADPELPAGLVTEDTKGNAYVPMDKVPPSDRSAIENVLRSKGQRITNDKIQRAYAATLLGDRALFDSIVSGK